MKEKSQKAAAKEKQRQKQKGAMGTEVTEKG